MQLAHQRMGEIGSQNLDLLQEVASLKETLSSRKSPDGSDSADEELQQVRERCSMLEAQIALLLANDTGIDVLDGKGREASQKEGQRRLEFKDALKRDIANTRGEPNSSDDSMIRQIAELNTELQLARASATALNEEKRQLEMELSSRLSTEGERVKRLQSDLQAKHHELDSLRNRIEALQEELAESKSSLGASLGQPENFGDAPGTREEELRELEHLRAANFAAEKWMEQAVEHHQMLTDKVAALEKGCEQLKEQLTHGKGTESNQTGEEHGVAQSNRKGDGNIEGAVRWSPVLEDAGSTAEGQALYRRGEGVFSNELEDELQALRVVRVELDATCASQKLKIEDLQCQVLECTEEQNRRALEIADIIAKLKEFEKEAETSQEKELALQVERLNSEKEALHERMEMLQLKLAYVSELEFELEEQRILVSTTNARLSQAKVDHEDLERSSLTLIKQWQGT
jgi:hypothetical protein